MELIKRFRLSKMLNNSFLIKEKNKIILIDAPDEIYKVIDYLDENELELNEVWLTHYHFDHLLGLTELKNKYKHLKVYIAEEEIECITNPNTSILEQYTDKKVEYLGEVCKNEELINEYPGLKIAYIAGHSKLSSVYIFEKEGIMFTGDVLFQGTIGRSDLEYGDFDALVKGIKKHLLVYENMEVYPGHGFKTTILQEKKRNPYLNE